jgi:hypothetical protein
MPRGVRLLLLFHLALLRSQRDGLQLRDEARVLELVWLLRELLQQAQLLWLGVTIVHLHLVRQTLCLLGSLRKCKDNYISKRNNRSFKLQGDPNFPRHFLVAKIFIFLCLPKYPNLLLSYGTNVSSVPLVI